MDMRISCGHVLQARATRVVIHANPSPQVYPDTNRDELCWKLECKSSRGQRCKLLLTVAPSTALTPNSDSEGTRAIRRFELCKQGPAGRTRGDGTASGRVERPGRALLLKSGSSVWLRRRNTGGVWHSVIQKMTTPLDAHVS
jgi:hypothetical protein